MTFNTYHVMLLKLIGCCKSLPKSVLESYPMFLLFSDISVLLEQRLVYQSRGDGSFRLTPLGYDVAGRLGGELPRDKQTNCHHDELSRRNQSAEILFTAFAAGYDVFAETVTDLQTPGTYLPSFALRRNKTQNLLSSARMTGRGRIPAGTAARTATCPLCQTRRKQRIIPLGPNI